MNKINRIKMSIHTGVVLVRLPPKMNDHSPACPDPNDLLTSVSDRNGRPKDMSDRSGRS